MTRKYDINKVCGCHRGGRECLLSVLDSFASRCVPIRIYLYYFADECACLCLLCASILVLTFVSRPLGYSLFL